MLSCLKLLRAVLLDSLQCKLETCIMHSGQWDMSLGKALMFPRAQVYPGDDVII